MKDTRYQVKLLVEALVNEKRKLQHKTITTNVQYLKYKNVFIVNVTTHAHFNNDNNNNDDDELIFFNKRKIERKTGCDCA